jgi:hypothetical protein
MKRLFAGTCLAALCAVGLSAQTPAQQPAQSQPMKDDKAVTVTGCLKAGATPGTFELADAKWDKGASSATGTSGAAGAAAAGASAAAKPSIKLTGTPSGAKLDDHVGHTVQITGKMAPASGTAGTSGTPGSAAAGPALNVETVKMVSSTCDGK